MFPSFSALGPRVAAVLGAALAFGLAACGSDGDGRVEPATTSAASATPPVPN